MGALRSQHVLKQCMFVNLYITLLGVVAERNEAFIGYAEQKTTGEATSVLLLSEYGKVI